MNHKGVALAGWLMTAHLLLASWVVETKGSGYQSEKPDDEDPLTEGGYRLVWADEFDQDGPPDAQNWSFEE